MKQAYNRKPPEEIVTILADKYCVSNRYVQMVISGERTNAPILEDYMIYKQEHNHLLTAVKKAVPFLN